MHGGKDEEGGRAEESRGGRDARRTERKTISRRWKGTMKLDRSMERRDEDMRAEILS